MRQLSYAAMRIYPCFSILSLQMYYVYTLILSLTVFLNSPSVPLLSPRTLILVQGDLDIQLSFRPICSRVSLLLYYLHNLSHLYISFINLETFQTHSKLGQGYFLLYQVI